MSKAINVVVERVSDKDVNTKFGLKKTYSFQAGGLWFNCGFKKPSVTVGQCISFDYTPDKYGNNADITTIAVGAQPTAASATAPVADSAPQPYASRYKPNVFPIPALDGQRAILRQNAITNARELLVGSAGGKAFTNNMDANVAEIIRMAKIFEAYTSGDMDVEEVRADIALDAAAGEATSA